MAESRAQAPAVANQRDSEFLASVETGMKSIESIFAKQGALILKRGAPNLREEGAFEVWSSRVVFEITSNEKLTPFLNTKKGVLSAYVAITRASVLGLMIGGSKPQAYFVPRDGAIKLEPKDDGMMFACVYGPGAVLAREPELVRIHENDGIRIDQARGRIIFPEGGVDPFGEGKLVGYAMELEYLDGRREVARITLAKCKEIEERYGRKDSPMYSKSPEEADEKTARKQLLKRPFAMAESLAMMRSLGGTVLPEVGQPMTEPEPPAGQEERVGQRLEGAMRNATPGAEEEGEAGEPSGAEGSAADDDDPF